MRSLCLALLCCLSLNTTLLAEDKPLTAGVARVDLTPPISMKASLGGYGARMSKPAEGVHDRVWLKCVVLNDGTKRLAIVTADSLCFPYPIRQAVMAKLKENNVNVDEVLILPSHTHTSFDLFALHPKNIYRIPQIGIYQQAAFDHVVAKLVEVITVANLDIIPVKVGTGRIQLEGWNRNRRGNRIADPDFTLTRIDATDGKPVAVIVWWTAHPTFLGPKDMVFSGDWPGALQRSLESLIGQGVTVLYANGAQGDQSPTPRPQSGESQWERVDDYGRDVAIKGYDLWKKITPTEVTNLAWKRTTFDLPKRSKHKDFMKVGGAEYGILDKTLDVLLMSLFPTSTQTLSVRLGDLQIVGVPGEMISELGMEVKKKVAEATGAKYVVIGGLADEWVSYILSDKEYQKGGYEATISFYGETLGSTIVDAVIKNASGVK
ncbi:MAG TPA: neutral/alkaline non-lysosomal ceramidase N-terminal domain-containing protein [Gemmatales bacterium]|nr:neutral/alkaline non-lysosomal ceramidase N-terminal domain-containing protein [Gemmatales bacterium]